MPPELTTGFFYPSEQVLEQNLLVTGGTKSGVVVRNVSNEMFVKTGRALIGELLRNTPCVFFLYILAGLSRKGGESTCFSYIKCSPRTNHGHEWID